MFLSEERIIRVCSMMCLFLPCLCTVIAAANILLTRKGMVKLGDFGASGQLTHTKRNADTQVGSAHWMAPEQAREDCYTEKVDIWQLGITVYEMATGKTPFAHCTSIGQLMRCIVAGHIPQLPPRFSPSIRQFLARCLVKDPQRRADVDELLQLPFVHKREDQFRFIRQLFPAITVDPTTDGRKSCIK